jgi:hypothetical protein
MCFLSYVKSNLSTNIHIIVEEELFEKSEENRKRSRGVKRG